MKTNQVSLTPLEREVLSRCIARVDRSNLRSLLEQQLDNASIMRTNKTVGYYLDFGVSDQYRIDIGEAAPINPMVVSARHPDGENAIDFVLYVKDGKLSFLEAASTSDWPQDEGLIYFWD